MWDTRQVGADFGFHSDSALTFVCPAANLEQRPWRVSCTIAYLACIKKDTVPYSARCRSRAVG